MPTFNTPGSDPERPADEMSPEARFIVPDELLVPGGFHHQFLEMRAMEQRLVGEREQRMGVDMSSKSKKIIEMTPDKEKALTRALIALMQEREAQLQQRNLPTERRESEYLSLMQDQRSAYELTAKDLMESELLIHLDRISSDTILSLAGRGHEDILKDKNSVSFVCHSCTTRIPQRFAFWCLGQIYCAEHVPQAEECIACHRIRTDYKEIRSIDGSLMRVCSSCLRRVNCRRCSKRVGAEYTAVRLCAECYHSNASSNNEYPRGYAKNTKWMSPDKLGPNIQSDRLFSCELESVVGGGDEVRNLLKTLPPEVGISGDNSIRAEGGMGIELQTPRLQGAKGEELLLRTVAALKTTEAEVNSSCGMHIHLDGAGLIPASRKEYPKALIQLWKMHLVFEDVILSFLPFKRRINRYCRPLRDYFKMSELSLLTSMFELEQLWYKSRSYTSLSEDKGHHYHPSRYFGVNFHSLLADHNLEIRYHSGTLNAKKIFHWVNLHSLIMDAAAGVSNEFLDEAQATTDLLEKTQMLFGMIGLNKKSQRYFLDRQRKFNDKQVEEDEQESSVEPLRRIISEEHWL